MARLCFLVVCIFIYSSALLVSAQDCRLPTIAEIEAALGPIIPTSDGNEVFSPNITEGSVQYVCLAQGSMIDTYEGISLIATFTRNPGEAERTRIFDIECNSGTWSGRTGSVEAPANDIIGVPPRTNCYRCRDGFGGNTRCRECDSACSSGLMRCTGSGSGDCCLSFTRNGQCDGSTDCTSSGPNYVATESNNFTCSCNLTCPNGFTVNSNCTDCDLVSICNASNPCMNGGRCIQNSPADNYTCDCTGTGHEGVNCTVMPSSTPSPTPSSTPVPSSTPSPSPSSTPTPVCTISNCASCQNSSCCKTCSTDFYLTNGCTCGPCDLPNCLRCRPPTRCCMTCESGYEVNDCGCEIMSSSVKPPEPTSTPERPSETTGFSSGTLIGVIIGTILGILLLLTLAAVVAYVIYYVAVGGGAAVTKAKPKSPFANGESHNNPLYLAPDDVAGEVAD
ncbi:PREDICTED: delta-like protein 1 [Amphimedon queenslandica]|uniref:EGF-like domain-containing protein n=1 Tax=Amphimedon queenslandica TaxID=400682 RepID=A0A1X7V784_AMPQE|nr:PREDICTED: delta-like protein 1 [Amphimedon queenslandica]|eukprot:XP_003385382.1 PREDICTED: delta-like protein 1 [Amphimedon queenslandica]